MNEQGQNSHKSDERLEIACKVDSLIRKYGLELFRVQTRQAASEYLVAHKECKSRQERRLDELKKNGVLHRDENLPDRPNSKKKNLVEWNETVRVKLTKRIKVKSLMPPKFPNVPKTLLDTPASELSGKQRAKWSSLKPVVDGWGEANNQYWQSGVEKQALLEAFQFVKERGFQSDTKCNYEYVFDLLGWIPNELSPDKDPSLDFPLPVPNRKLSVTERVAGLSALYDAWFLGAEKIAPWGTRMPNEAEVLSGLPLCGTSEDQFQQANWYYHLVCAAKELNVKDMPYVESWLADVESELLKGKAESAAVPDTADTKTDTKKIKERNLPPNKVNETARYVRSQRKEIAQEKRLQATLNALIAEHLSKDENSKEVKSMARQLQPSRYGWLLEIGQPPDK